MNSLPEGWAIARLDKIAAISTGKRDANHAVENGQYLFFTCAKETLLSNTYAFDDEAILLPGNGANVGHVFFYKGKFEVYQRTYVLHQIGIHPQYLYFQLLHKWKQSNLEKQYGSATNYIRMGNFTDYELPIAPLNEQKRIAAKLDALLQRVDACRAHLERVPLLLKRFRQAVLAAATSGQLTEDWRETNPLSSQVVQTEIRQKIEQWQKDTPPNKTFKEPAAPDLSHWKLEPPDTWATVSISSFAKCLDYLRVPVKREERASLKGLYPYYGANGLVDMVDEFIFDDELVLVTEDETFYGREKPIAYRASGRCWVNNHAHVLQAGDKISSDYLCYCLMYYDVLPWLTGTTGRAKLTQGVLNSLPIAVPPKQEIEEIVRRVETLFAYADRLEARCHEARAQVEQLTPALLAKAFRGELVPQDPTDEPASVLLERLRAERAATETKPRRIPKQKP